MHPINILTSHAVPLDRPNVDTDQIIPKQFLKRIERTGYGDFLFYDWRRIQEGPNAGEPHPDFVLNKHHHKGAKILIAGKNFGCGSSREHAAWALTDFGFLAVIAPSFADIFFSNAGKNGMVLVRLPEADVETLMHRSEKNPAHKITINLEAQTITDDEGFSAHFDIDPFRKYCLLNGLDDIGLTLRHEAELDTYESQTRRRILAQTPKHRGRLIQMSDFENVRKSYRPRRITTLFVGESAPHGGTFFYNQNSGLFREIRKAFKGTELFLEDFKRNGFYLDDLVLEPVNHLERQDRISLCRQSVSSFAKRLRNYKPEAIVILLHVDKTHGFQERCVRPACLMSPIALLIPASEISRAFTKQ